ncbi:hypothetical protein GMRT_13339 [Giardia muris]|uniref:Uncharacterized protein n=1 Tax=Giardia muris TaxID=5742 RepID=A0A4Z1SKW1_GIAMU|nr:hypothetical protein GMRT_13339 [Giardia muris]|eukprot:TNJ26304.1 hypothetical protein GMRT_13339 [Giardia muris]
MPLPAGFYLPNIQRRRSSTTRGVSSPLSYPHERSPEGVPNVHLPLLRPSVPSQIRRNSPKPHRGTPSPTGNTGPGLRVAVPTGIRPIDPAPIPISSSTSLRTPTGSLQNSGVNYIATPIQRSPAPAAQLSDGLFGVGAFGTLPQDGGVVQFIRTKSGAMTIMDRMIRMYTTHDLKSIYDLKHQLLQGISREDLGS